VKEEFFDRQGQETGNRIGGNLKVGMTESFLKLPWRTWQILLLGICCLREAPERANDPDRRAGK
jgi:hypothetical protein